MYIELVLLSWDLRWEKWDVLFLLHRGLPLIQPPLGPVGAERAKGRGRGCIIPVDSLWSGSPWDQSKCPDQREGGVALFQ